MSLGKRLINTGAVPACTTDSTDPFGDSSGVALYNLDYDASTAPDGTDYSGTPSNVTFGVGGKINYGARFNGSSAFIDLGDANQFENNKISFSFWCRALGTAAQQQIFAEYTGGALASGELVIRRESDEKLTVGISNGSNYLFKSTDSAVLTTSYKHFVVVIDTTQSTDDKIKIYVNNAFSASTNISSSGTVTGNVLTRSSHLFIGKRNVSAYQYFNGDLDQVRIFSKSLNQTEVASLFAETACVYTSTTDIVNYPTGTTPVAYIPFDNSAEDLVSGDLGTIASGMDFKFGRYGQAIRTTANAHFVNFPNISESPNSPFSYSCWANITDINQRIYLFSWATASGATSAWGGILNGGGGKPYFNFCSNAATASTITVPENQWFHYVATYDGTTAKAYVDNELALTANISNNNLGTNTLRILDTITDTEAMIDQVRIYDSALDTDDIAELYNEKPETDTSTFKTVLYEGNGGTQYISNVGFDLDVDDGGDGGLVWIKARTTGASHSLQDTVNGEGQSKNLYSDNTGYLGQYGVYGFLSTFEANGFFVDAGSGSHTNANNQDYVAWVWKGGGDAVQNNDGTIQGANCIVSANTDAGFSIVKYTGNSTAGATIGHSLSAKPEFILIKNLDSALSWIAYDTNINSVGYLDLSDAFATSRLSWGFNNTDPTDTLITLGSNNAVNASNNDYIAYCFHSVAGVSKIGTYDGLGTSVVTETGLGFKPSWVLIKNITNSANWNIYDSRIAGSDVANFIAYPNLSNSIISGSHTVTMQTDGFQVSATNHLQNNKSGNTYIYMAFK